jgi:hypothetical protein
VALAAQSGGNTRVLIVTGLSAEPQYARRFNAAAAAVYDAARTKWHVADSNLVYLAEDSTVDAGRHTRQATRSSIGAALTTIAARVQPGDVVLVFIVGHGAGEMATSVVNVMGPDPTAADFATWLAPLGKATLIFVNASSASGDFGKILGGPNRVIVTATKTALERNESIFVDFFSKALTTTDADANKDGQVSVAEAFTYARNQVAKAYESTSRLLTEHAVMVDSSGIAARIAFGGAMASDDPRVIALVGERRVLEGQVDSLRGVKSTMDSTAYEKELERLLLLIATKSQAIRALQPGSKP